MTGSDVAREIAGIEALLAECTEWVTSGGAAASDAVPGVSAWSPLQHLDHAARATQSVLAQVDRILAGDAACLPPGPLSASAEAISRSERIPRGVAEAPRPMHPDPSPSPADVAVRLRDLRAALEAAVRRTSEIAAAGRRLPHFVLGPMTPAEWLRFARIHLEHHLAIAREASLRRGAG